ncbi:MAG: histidinol-phosphate transaminase [bacterium]|nr:histidinol-phosphate transaminase [bacterium]MDD5354649.1 histidinol-phosphate transaminase [bacterium]
MIEKLIRKNILQFQPYIPGKPIAEVKRELGLKRVIKLASNENPLGPSLKALQAVKKALNSVFLYPEGSGILLKRKIAKKLALRPSNIILGNGSDELIEIIGKTFLDPGDEIIVSADGFIRYKMAGDLMCCGVIAVPSKDHKHDLAGMKAAITPKTKVIFIINPNNPTGTYVSERELVEFFQGLREDIIVVFDEAYYEYATQKDYPQTLDYLRKGKNVIILRTFSKIYALAGLRVGYGLAGEELISYLERVRPPFNVNSLAQVAAEVSLDDKQQIKRSLALVEKEKKKLYRELDKLSITYIPSAANFVLIDLKREAGEISKKLLASGVIVRPMGEYKLPTCIRVTIGLPAENNRFVSALRKLL